MSLLENLVQGFSAAADAPDAVNRIEGRKRAELEANTTRIFDDLRGLQARKQQLDPNSPTYKQDAAEIDAQIGNVGKAFHDLYHPSMNPGAIHHLGDFVKKHVLHQQVPTTPGQAKQSMQQMLSDLDMHAAVPPTQVNPYIQKKQQLTAAGATPEQVSRGVFGDKPEQENWVPTNVKLPDGSEVTWQRNSKSGEWTDLAGNPIPKDKLQTAITAPKGAGAKPIRAWKKVNGKTTSVLLDPATNKVIPGSENPDIIPPATMTGRISTGYYHFVDADGNVHQVKETHTSTPAGEAGGSAAVPKTPKEAKDSASKAVGDTIIGKKDTPVVTSAKKDVTAAVKLSSIADQVAKAPDDAINQKRLAVALERVSAGRFTTQALDYIIKAGWGNTIEQWANNPSTGALPKDVLRQLVDGAHQNETAARAALKEAQGGDDEDEFLMNFRKKPNAPK